MYVIEDEHGALFQGVVHNNLAFTLNEKKAVTYSTYKGAEKDIYYYQLEGCKVSELEAEGD